MTDTGTLLRARAHRGAVRDAVFVWAAQAAHEAIRAYCLVIGDDTHVGWDEAPEWQKKSAIAGVQFIYANPDAGPSATHDSWLEDKRRDGWSYGPVKDPAKKEHPCFVPYEELPVGQRAKDHIFGAVVRGVLSHHGLFEPHHCLR